MDLVIQYSDKSSTTGKRLKESFELIANKVIKKNTNKRLKTDVLLRWGSTEEFTRLKSRLELNTLDAVCKTSEKQMMMKTLVNKGIRTPNILFNLDNTEAIDGFRDETGNFYIRGINQEIRYDSELRFGDLYISKPIKNKRREYRVHVFNGEVIAIYEKVPNEENIKLFKSFNCHFRRVNPDNCKCSKEDQEECIRAVNSLGLLFGGVDLVRTKDKQTFVIEVNSAPGLNSVGIDRYVDKIIDYCRAMEVLC